MEFINDEGKINLQPGDLFDRIINLRLTCAKIGADGAPTSETEVFVIRSDYELILPSTSFDTSRRDENYDGRYIVRRCTQKPSIKVQCKMVTSNVGTSVGVTISNFFMLTKDGNHIRSFNASNYQILAVEIFMGYWGQFKDTIDLNSTDLLSAYFDLKVMNGADKITIVSPVVVTTEKLPPDSALHLKGYVSEIYSNPIRLTKISTPVDALAKPVATSGSDLKGILFDNITRRYINEHVVVEDRDPNIKRRNQLPSFASEDESIVINGKDIRPVNEDGQILLSVDDAKEYGVQVYLSKGAQEVKLASIIDSQGNEVTRKVYFEAGWTIGQTIARIVSYMDTELDFTFSLNGDVLIYTPKEMQDIEEISSEYETQGLYKQTVLADKQLYNGRLPAVYNINIDAVATIVCPFFTFLQPFQYVEFASRYALTSVVSYFATYEPTISRFLVINASISFATVDDVNEVQITAVSAKNNGEQE